jgi:hypothetical protein
MKVDDELDRLRVMPEPREVYVVVARPVTAPSMTEFLAAYSTRGRAESFVYAQDESRRGCLEIWPVHLDSHPGNPFWAKPDETSS